MIGRSKVNERLHSLTKKTGCCQMLVYNQRKKGKIDTTNIQFYLVGTNPALYIVVIDLVILFSYTLQGRIQDIQLGRGALKKIVPNGGRRENLWGISCEKSRFYANKSYFFQFQGGGGAGCAPPLDPLLVCNKVCRITWGIIWIFQNGGQFVFMKLSIQFLF